MNGLKRMALIAFSGLVLVLSACGPAGSDDEKAKSERVLHSPPYASLTDSIEAFPDNLELRLRRAAMLSENNLHRLATPDFAKAWEISGDEEIALGYVANLLMADHASAAIGLLQECTARFPHNTEFNRRLGEVFVQQGKPASAMEQFDLLIARDSFNFEAWFDRGVLLARMNDTLAAIASLEKSFALMPVNHSGMLLANLYIARKNPRALEICDLLIKRDSVAAHIDPLLMKGIYYAEVNDHAKALEIFDECIRRDWKTTEAYIEKGIILFERKSYDEALKTFTMAATVSNTDPDAYFWMGRCYEAMGDTEQARLNFERALALDETFTEAKEALRRMNG